MSKLIDRLREHALVELKLRIPQNKKQNVVAIVYDKKGKVYSIGLNSFTKTGNFQANLAKKVKQDDKVFLHAEVAALLRWRRFTNKAPYGVFVARLGRNGSLSNAKPCDICAMALEEAGIKVINHT
jgi:tRNA(Arg) A34 adenosine deaminase TadA